jgi:hypothetical protein
MKTRNYLFILLLMLSSAVSAQMNKTDVTAFFDEADKNSVDYIIIFAELKYDVETRGFATKRSYYKTSETSLGYKETCLVLKNSKDLIYIPYSSIRTLYKGKNGWGDKSEKGIIKIDLIGNENIRIK